MIKNNLKITIRNLRKNWGFTVLNILGLTMGFSGFILSYQYINREISYDKWNPNYEQIYLVGLTENGKFSEDTPPSLAPLIQAQLPEVVRAGRAIHYPYGGYPLFGESTVFLRKAMLVDSAAASIFQVQSKTGPLYKSADQKEASLINQAYADRLFKADDMDFDTPKAVPMLSLATGMQEMIYGIAADRPLSILNYDLLLIKEIQDERASGNPFSFQTYIQVKENTDIAQLQAKLTALFQQELVPQDPLKSTNYSKGGIYLDPLSNLHLRPKAGSNSPYLLVWVIGLISGFILVLAGANFANMMLAQANSRLKELAIKKILGSSRSQIMLQLLIEVLLITLSAALLSCFLLLLSANILQQWFYEDVKAYLFSSTSLLQLGLAVLLTTLLSGVYPAVVISRFNLNQLLKGETGATGSKQNFRHALLGIQVLFALIFVVGLLVVQQQVHYIKQAEKGFEPAQIVNIKGIGLYFNPNPGGNFEDFKTRLEQSPYISSASSATNIPGDITPAPNKEFSYAGKAFDMAHLGIDSRYFKTLGIETIAGQANQSLSQLLQDSTKHYAVINESAAKALGLKQAIGSNVKGCGVNFEIIAIVKDSKVFGFENQVVPTLYSYRNECSVGRYMTTLMVKTKAGYSQEAIASIVEEWAKVEAAKNLPLDYEYMDQKYAQLHAKQDELQTALSSFTGLSVILVAFGLFSMSLFQISQRKREISIRKVLGASVGNLFLQLNQPFIIIFSIGCVLGIPIAYYLLHHWLANFAYHIELHWGYFAVAAVLVFLLILVVVSLQTLRAAKANPVENLRNE